MPHFTIAVDPSGNGPLLTAVVGVSEPRRAALAEAGVAIPTPVPVRALVDTGASMTCVDPIVLVDGLGLTPKTQIPCLTPTTGSSPEMKDVYDVSVLIFAKMNEPALEQATMPVMASDLFAAQGIHALIGRDILARCLLHYNGDAGLFTLAF